MRRHSCFCQISPASTGFKTQVWWAGSGGWTKNSHQPREATDLVRISSISRPFEVCERLQSKQSRLSLTLCRAVVLPCSHMVETPGPIDTGCLVHEQFIGGCRGNRSEQGRWSCSWPNWEPCSGTTLSAQQATFRLAAKPTNAQASH